MKHLRDRLIKRLEIAIKRGDRIGAIGLQQQIRALGR